MARRKGIKQWDEITTEGWLALMGDTSVMSRLMMQIFSRLYHSADYMDNAKNIAEALHMEYRALNAGVGWAGNKIREMYEKGELLTYGDHEEQVDAIEEHEGEEFTLKEATKQVVKRSPWEYVFDGVEGDGGLYFWILKPEAVRAYRELMDANIWNVEPIRQMLEEDETSSGVEGNLFSENSETTVSRIRRFVDEEQAFRWKSLSKDPCCVVCGAKRLSLLQAVPYGTKGKNQKGLLFCPTHAALFAAHLITFDSQGHLLISRRLTTEEEILYHISKDMKAQGPYSKKRMTAHRKIFMEEERKLK